MKKKCYTLKYIILGDVNVGKTNILFRFRNKEFENDVRSTIGVDFKTIKIKVGEISFRLNLWDTAGSEKYRSLNQGYYKDADCAIIVYDITSKKTFQSVKGWIEDCKSYVGNKTPLFVLVGNKIDLKNEREVKKEEGQALAKEYDILFFESSALTGYNIENIFTNSCYKIYENITNGNNGSVVSSSEMGDNESINDTIRCFDPPMLMFEENLLEKDRDNDQDRRNKCCC